MAKRKEKIKLRIWMAGGAYFTLSFKDENRHHFFCEAVNAATTKMVSVTTIHSEKMCIRPSFVIAMESA